MGSTDGAELTAPTDQGMAPSTDDPRRRLSVVVPAYNEQEVLPEFHKRLSSVADGLGLPCEIIYVNDGSSDDTLSVMRRLGETDPRVAIVNLSRNFGKEIALTAGLDHATGDAVVAIDADLQDPPELIPDLVRQWNEGFDVVYAKRVVREGETWLKKATASAFYRFMGFIGGRVVIPRNTGDFRLLNRRALDALLGMREHHRFMKGLFAWIGYRQKEVPYRRDPRFAGETKWNYWRLWNFSLEGITSFTIAPLKVASYVGIVVAFLAALYAVWIIYKTLAFGEPVAGYPSLMVVVLFLGGVQLTTLGIIGEYLGRIFNETKRRPLYFVENYTPASAYREAETD